MPGVLWISETDGLAIALIGTNGDGREVEASLYGCADGEWTEWVNNFGTGSSPSVVFTCGYALRRQASWSRTSGSSTVCLSGALACGISQHGALPSREPMNRGSSHPTPPTGYGGLTVS
jgi:hypothetical protein